MTPLFLFNFFSWDDWQAWLDEHLMRLIAIVVLLVVADLIFRRLLTRVLARAWTRAARVRHEDPVAIKRRADTLRDTLNWVVATLLGFLGVALILTELGLNVSALIATAGVAGVALGFGAQTFVRDLINGIFILTEDQYGVGDTVTVAGVTGEVIEINPRRTVVRDSDGNVHSVPNGTITVATNKTPGLNRFVVELDVAFGDADTTRGAVDDLGEEMLADGGTGVVGRPYIGQTTVLPDGSVSFKVMGEAGSGSRWDAESEFRRRLKRRLDEAEVRVHFGPVQGDQSQVRDDLGLGGTPAPAPQPRIIGPPPPPPPA